MKVLQEKCIRIFTFSGYTDSTNPLFISLKLLKFNDILESEILKFFLKFQMDKTPRSLIAFFTTNDKFHSYSTRSSSAMHIPNVITVYFGRNSLRFSGTSSWNRFYTKLSDKNTLLSIARFKSYFKKACFESYENH